MHSSKKYIDMPQSSIFVTSVFQFNSNLKKIVFLSSSLNHAFLFSSKNRYYICNVLSNKKFFEHFFPQIQNNYCNVYH